MNQFAEQTSMRIISRKRVARGIRFFFLLFFTAVILFHPGQWLAGLASFALSLVLSLVQRDLFFQLFRVELIEQWVASAYLLFGTIVLVFLLARQHRGGKERDVHPEGRGAWSRLVTIITKTPSAAISVGILLLIISVAFLSPILAPADPEAHVDIAVTKYRPPVSSLTFLNLKKSRWTRFSFPVTPTEGFVGSIATSLSNVNRSLLNEQNASRRLYLDEYRVEEDEIRYRQGNKWRSISTSELAGGDEDTWIGRRLLILGSDQFGRDVLARLMFGSRISLFIGFFAVFIAITLGSVVGVVSGYFGGPVDAVLMRFVDTLLSFPVLFVLLLAIALFGNSVILIILFLGLTSWMPVARLTRGEVLSLRERGFVQAARVLGFSSAHILVREILPNALAPVIVAATLQLGGLILVEAGLSFLGLGVQPPTASWGNMIGEGANALGSAWWLVTVPGLAIVVTVVSVNYVGEAFREALNPRVFIAD